ncbi:MAG TPA: pilus assembly protein PilM [Candidatus Ozemobacteraceae bacterium]|nr:pilus assembly protein PilM [Candidatus Ozemobacteraceae bacterium]
MRLFTEYVAIDIGTSAIKGICLDHVNGNVGYKPAALVSEPVPEGMIGGGFTNPSITNFAGFEALLRRVFAGLRGSRQGCIVGLPDRWVKLHLHDLTLKSGEADSAEFLRWRMKRDLQVPAGMEVEIDHQLLSVTDTPDGKRCRYLVGMVRRDILDAVSQCLANMRIQLMAFDTSSLGVYNLLEALRPENAIDRHLMLFHIGHETTVVKCFDDGILRYERVIESAGSEFSRHCADLHPDQAGNIDEYKKNGLLFPTDTPGLLAAIPRRHELTRIFGNWLRELNVTIRFYQEKFKIQKLPRVYLTGGSSLFQGLPEFLSAYAGTPCERFNPLVMLPGFDGGSLPLVGEGPRFAPCLGLLME